MNGNRRLGVIGVRSCYVKFVTAEREQGSNSPSRLRNQHVRRTNLHRYRRRTRTRIAEVELKQLGLHVVGESHVEQAVESARASLPDLILMGAEDSTPSDIELCHILKAEHATKGVPIVLLSNRSSAEVIVTGLECGADDYIAEPFAFKVLATRLKAILRRKKNQACASNRPIRIGDFVLDPNQGNVVAHGNPIALSAIEFKLLYLLASKPGRTFSRDQIAAAILEEGREPAERFVDLQLNSLRKRLGEWGSRIQTVRGVGYQFKP